MSSEFNLSIDDKSTPREWVIEGVLLVRDIIDPDAYRGLLFVFVLNPRIENGEWIE